MEKQLTKNVTNAVGFVVSLIPDMVQVSDGLMAVFKRQINWAIETSVKQGCLAVQVHAVQSLVNLDTDMVDVQRQVLYTLYSAHANFEHLEKAFDEYQSIYSVYVEEMLPHQKTALIKYCVATYADLDIDRITYNL
jgi:hypothetical protein